jgi:hypothetical protein
MLWRVTALLGSAALAAGIGVPSPSRRASETASQVFPIDALLPASALAKDPRRRCRTADRPRGPENGVA